MTQLDQWVTIAAASQHTGIPVRTLHRWVARGQLHAITGQHGRLVELDAVRRLATVAGYPAAVSTPQAGQNATGVPDDQMATPRPANGSPWQVMADLVAQNDRLHQENLELAGRCGWLQAELEQARQRIALLEVPTPEVRNDVAPNSEATAVVDKHPAPEVANNVIGNSEVPTPEIADNIVGNSEAAAETDNHPTGHTNGHHLAAQTPLRPWWRRAIQWLAQPV